MFIDASYEGDLMARSKGVSYTWGREAQSQYNESGAGSQGTLVEYRLRGMDHMSSIDPKQGYIDGLF